MPRSTPLAPLSLPARSPIARASADPQRVARHVLAFLAGSERPHDPASLILYLGYSEQQINTALADLRSDGLVESAGMVTVSITASGRQMYRQRRLGE